MTITLYVLAYLVIGFGGMGALVWWRPGWFYRWVKERTQYWDGWVYDEYGEGSHKRMSHTTPAHWEMRVWWPFLAVVWPLSLLYYAGAGALMAVVTTVETYGRAVTAKLDRLREIDQEVAALRAERERMLKEAGL